MINISKVIFDNQVSFFYLYNNINLCDWKTKCIVENILYTVILFMGLDPKKYFTKAPLKIEDNNLTRIQNKQLYDLILHYFTCTSTKNFNTINCGRKVDLLLDNMVKAKKCMCSRLDIGLESTVKIILSFRNSNGTFGDFDNYDELFLCSALSLLIITEFLTYRLDNVIHV